MQRRCLKMNIAATTKLYFSSYKLLYAANIFFNQAIDEVQTVCVVVVVVIVVVVVVMINNN